MNLDMKAKWAVPVIIGISMILIVFSGTSANAGTPVVPPPNFKVAFIGDQGFGANSVSVLQLIKDEGAQMVLHQGDFEYANNPNAWDNQINSVLGADFPYFASAGNHDKAAWSGYQQKLNERLARISGAVCSGDPSDLGVQSSCTYQGLFFILTAPGVFGSGYDTFIKDELSRDDSIWSICSWHRVMNAMQVGSKGDQTGWPVYEECRIGGAIIATAHEHSYERTRTLSSMQNQIIDPDWSDPNNVRVSEGSSFAFVSGLAGRSIRDQDRCLPFDSPYGCNNVWASIYTSDQGANFGALFCSFNVDGLPYKANCYFKDISGNTPDKFTITSHLGDSDADGIPEFADVCPGFDDTIDSDGDGIPDACDAFPNDPANDVDEDGFGANEDNCPLIANPGQEDADVDGIGDACDETPEPEPEGKNNPCDALEKAENNGKGKKKGLERAKANNDC